MPAPFNRQMVIAAGIRRRKKRTLIKRYASIRRRAPFTPSVPVVVPHYRRAADTIIEEPNGNMLWANGIDAMLRFTPYNALLESAGVVAPSSAISLTGTGTGAIVGTYYAYSRFVDRDGQFSSLSPISNVYTPVVTSGTVSNVTNASPMVVTYSGSAISTGQIVKISGVLGNAAANGTWSAGAATATTFSLLNGDGSASLGNGVYNSGGTINTGVSQIQYLNVPIPTEAKVVRRQILRNKDGEASVFYIDIDTTDLTSTTFLSGTDSLSLSGPVAIFDTNGNSLVDKTIPPNFKKFIGSCLGRIFAAGVEFYSEGAVVVTSGSAIVTGIGTEWNTATFAGRTLTIVGGNKSYLIQSCDSLTQLTLTTAYTGTTDQYSAYTITPNNPIPADNFNEERRTFYWSEPAQPEAWPVTNQNTLEEDPGAGELTGLMAMGPFLYILAEARIYSYSFVDNPLTDGFSTKAARRGCVNNRCWVQTEMAAFMLDQRGIHMFMGNDDNAIGSVEVQDLFRPRQGGKYKINWTARRHFHAVFDPGETIIRWFVTMSGSYTPRHAICYQMRLRRWWIEEYPFPVSASCLGRLNGKPQVFLGSDAKRVFALNASTLDALDPTTGTVSGTVTSSGVDWIADSSATFPSANVANTSLTITQGKGKGQKNIIRSVSGTQINCLNPWTDRPDTTSQYQIGGVSWTWKSGWNTWRKTGQNDYRSVAVQIKPTSVQAPSYMRIYEDFSETAKATATTSDLVSGNGIACLQNDPATDYTIDTTRMNGYVIQRLDSSGDVNSDAPRFMAVELGGVTSSDSLQVRGIKIDGVGG